MSEASRDLVASAESNKAGPDYFGFYTREVAELLSEDEEFLPFMSQNSELSGGICGEVKDRDINENCCNGKEANSFTGSGSLFSNGIASRISDFRKERLKTLLRQSVFALTQEVDEIMDPVVAMHRIRSHLRHKRCQSSSGSAFDGDAGKFPHKKLKMSSSSSTGIHVHANPVNFESSREGSGSECANAGVLDIALSEKAGPNLVENSACCYTADNSGGRTGPEGPKQREPLLGSSIGAEKENEVNDDLQFLLENDSSQVEATMKKYSDELSATLNHMEKHLEELLDTVMSKCRPMTLAEKQQLQKLIQKLPSRNLDRVVEIIKRGKLSKEHSCEEIHVDLEKEDNVTLWRLYYYVEAVENARKRSL